MKKPILFVLPFLMLLTSCGQTVANKKPSSSTSSFAPTPSSYNGLDYFVTFECKHSTVSLENGNHKSGSEVTFTFETENGYSFNKLDIVKSTDNLFVNYVKNVNSVSFVMPESAVTVKLTCCINDPLPSYQKTAQDEKYEKLGYKNAVRDICFKKGFTVRKSSNAGNYLFNNPIDIYEWGKEPIWNFTQWMTDYEVDPDTPNYDLTSLGTKHTISRKNNRGETVKSLTVDSSDGSFNLATNSSLEYNDCNGIAHSEFYNIDWWIHYLIEQEFDNGCNVSKCSSIIMSLEYEVDKCDHILNFYKNTAILSWYITLINRNEKSSSYDTYIWFGLPLYSNVDAGRIDGGYYNFEHGSHVGIYKPSSGSSLSTKRMPYVGETVTIEFEIYDYLRIAYFSPMFKTFWETTSWDDLYIGGMNIGYELFGAFDISCNFKNLGVYYK